MLWFGVAPLFAALSPFYFVLWGPGVAVAHLVFSVTISILLVEAMLLEFWKIPFTCSYPPGKANVTTLWIFYWLAFTTYAYSMASLEAWMVLKPVRLFCFTPLWQGYGGSSIVIERRWDAIGFTLVFEDCAGADRSNAGVERDRVAQPAGCSAGNSRQTRFSTGRVSGASARPAPRLAALRRHLHPVFRT